MSGSALVTLVGFGAIGWVDDWRKVVEKNPSGLASRWKYFWQSVIAVLIASWLAWSAHLPAQTELIVPFFKQIVMPLGAIGFVVLAYFVIVGTSNAVNLTDGADGLAILPTVMVSGALAVFAYVAGHAVFSKYLGLPHIPGAGELAMFCGALVGAGLAFLWFNAYPAEVFMGDVGALALGASPWVWWRSWCARRSSSSSWAACSSCRGRLGHAPGRLLQAAQESGSSSWPRSITTSRRRAGRKPKSSSASGSSAMMLVFIGLASLKLR
jgi:hypothetical protein